MGTRAVPSLAAAVAALEFCMLPATAQGGADRKGLAIVAGPDRSGFVQVLETTLEESGRFRVLTHKPGIRVQLPGLLPDPPLTVAQRNTLRTRSPARFLLFASVARRTEYVEEFGNQVATSSVDVSLRALDLELGDVTPLMTSGGRDYQDLARQALKFLRVQYPLRARVTGMREGAVFLDVGRKDGIDRGTVFVIRRQAGASDHRVGTVVVTSSADWYAVSEVDESVPGRQPQAGDVAIEDTSAILAGP